MIVSTHLIDYNEWSFSAIKHQPVSMENSVLWITLRVFLKMYNHVKILENDNTFRAHCNIKYVNHI